MDVERTMQFILDQQATFAANMERLGEQQAQFAANLDRYRQNVEARFERNERQIRAIRVLVKAGRKLLVAVQEQQKQTDAKLTALIDSLHRGANRHSE